MAKSSKKPDSELFKNFNPPADTPIQKVMPVKENVDDVIEQILFHVPGTFKKDVKIYVANKKMSIKDFFMEAGRQYIINHP